MPDRTVENVIEDLHRVRAPMPAFSEAAVLLTGRTPHPSGLNRAQRRARVRSLRRELLTYGSW